MAKETKSQLSKRETSILKFRWEFLRRNKQYQREYKSLVRKFSLDDSKQIRLKDIDDGVADGFFEKWEIKEPINPSKSFEDLLKSRNKNWFVDVFKEPVKAIVEKDDVQKFDEDEVVHRAGMAYFEIDMSAPVKQILFEVETEIGKWKKRMNIISKKRKWDEEFARPQINLYEKYLLIYDLKQQGKTLREIAKIVYPDEYEKYTEYSSKKYDVAPLTEKVKNNLKACQELIDQEYQIIR